MKREVRLQGIFHIPQKPLLSGSPVKEPSSKVPLRNPSLRDAPPLEPTVIHLSPQYMSPPSHVRSSLCGKGPPWRETPASRGLFNISSRLPSEGTPLRPPPWSLFRERCPVTRAPFFQFSKSPVDEPSSMFPKTGPLL